MFSVLVFFGYSMKMEMFHGGTYHPSGLITARGWAHQKEPINSIHHPIYASHLHTIYLYSLYFIFNIFNILSILIF